MSFQITYVVLAIETIGLKNKLLLFHLYIILNKTNFRLLVNFFNRHIILFLIINIKVSMYRL